MADTPALKTTFALIVVNYGSSLLLERNLSTINVRDAGGFVVVVDNFTNRQEKDRVANMAAENEWDFLALDSNEGFGGGVNAGAKVAFGRGAESIITLNPDASINSNDLKKLAEIVHAEPDLMVAPTIRTSQGNIWFDGMWLFQESGRVASNRRRKQPRGAKASWITGACFAISRELWQKVGGFDDDYFLYWEDVDLSRRVVRNGGRLSVAKNLTAIHDEGGTQRRAVDSQAKSDLYYYYNIRNRLVFAAKHLSHLKFLSWIAQTPFVSYEILLNGGRRQLLHSVGPWKAYIQGILSGIIFALKIRHR
ncbi:MULTISPECIES: glycosyltransferase family 2 protein [Micrococcaceae]|uniref:glycosyltransferase family 2 protein n=1 Tax=Micrococcaceae TaxID=1268 RepID=UPI000BB72C85|nr:glycosyltransferase family 2 protein [Glutamicibacter sp. BW78]PCC25745.1 hypothetical protein CIK75_04480 [Glutamicibacter sp. BW78]